ncbi:uncharacterized protein LOC143031990 isoform X2 [Oratosquilla oratoria]|uniref:uncharacterized protein LOC143031990 isoform X2 n=1 Tax=Oratosquilla oratoria TaxID=337810 RepID=UPI003F759246
MSECNNFTRGCERIGGECVNLNVNPCSNGKVHKELCGNSLTCACCIATCNQTQPCIVRSGTCRPKSVDCIRGEILGNHCTADCHCCKNCENWYACKVRFGVCIDRRDITDWTKVILRGTACGDKCECLKDTRSCAAHTLCEAINGTCINRNTDRCSVVLTPLEGLCGDSQACVCCAKKCNQTESCTRNKGICVSEKHSYSNKNHIALPQFVCEPSCRCVKDHFDCDNTAACKRKGGTCHNIATGQCRDGFVAMDGLCGKRGACTCCVPGCTLTPSCLKERGKCIRKDTVVASDILLNCHCKDNCSCVKDNYKCIQLDKCRRSGGICKIKHSRGCPHGIWNDNLCHDQFCLCSCCIPILIHPNA